MIVATVIGAVACATAPKSESSKNSLEAQASASIDTMVAKDPGIRSFIDRSVGYAVFPSIGKGGFIVGGAHGRGVLYERGAPTGFVELNQASIGAQIGGQSFAELIVFDDQAALERLKAGQFNISGDVSAVALTAGASAQAEFRDGIAVFTMPKGGLMAELSVTGQKIDYEPRGG